MKITKFGHSCILLDDGKIKILFDPGVYSDIPNLSVDGIIITHVHADHLDINKLQAILANCSAMVISNSEVKEELDKHNIKCEVVEEGSSVVIGGINIEAFGNNHAIMHPDAPKFQNTGYLVNEQIFHPGDALFIPPKPVEILLLPISAPWSKLSETLDYITAVKAKLNFPIHDGFLKDGGAFYRFGKMWCENNGLQFLEPENNKEYGF